MAHSRLMELASQAEEEGITLGELLARDMPSDEMEAVQAELASEIADGYWNVADFMRNVDVPSLRDILESGPEGHLDVLWNMDPWASDAV